MRFDARSTRYAAITAFFVIGPVLIEFLTGNVPLTTFADPVALVVLSISYGGGALLIRDTVARWHKGFPSILLLGLGYGIVNEAVQSGGYFDPRFYSVIEMGLEGFARWGGINVFWSCGITVFHAVFSIAVPIVIVDALFPVHRPLLGRVSYGLLLALFIGNAIFLHIVLDKLFSPRATPAPLAWLIVAALMVLLVLAARWWPTPRAARDRRSLPPVILFGFGAAGAFGFFFTYTELHHHLASPWLNFAALATLVALPCAVLVRFPAQMARERMALAIGAEVVLIAIALSKGVVVPAAAVIVLLALAWWRAAGAGHRDFDDGPTPALGWR